MENKYSKNILLAIMGVLIIVAIVARVATIQTAPVSAVTQLISLVFVAVYGFVLFRKPHGNLLKYAMLIFVFSTIFCDCYYLILGHSGFHIVKIFAATVVCYCAGRLNRIDQNKYIMPIIGIVYLGISIYATAFVAPSGPMKYLIIPSRFIFTINYFTIMIAYFVRYKEHKEAGLMDAPKDKLE